MRRIIVLLVALSMLLTLTACGAKPSRYIQILYTERVEGYEAEPELRLDEETARDYAAIDRNLWNFMVGADEYVHAYDKYYDNHGPIRSDKEDVVSITERIDKKYPSELRVIGVNNDYAQDYIKAAQAFFDATQNYSLYIVSYAQFGGSEYRKLLEECEELVDQCRLEVVDARLAFLSTVGLSLDR